MTKAPKTTKAEAPNEAPKAAKPAKAAADTKAAKPAKEAAKAPPKGTKVEKPKPGNKPNALQQPLKPSADLGAIVGTNPLPRGEVVSKVWDYIKKHNLQDAANKRNINADDKLKAIFKKPQVSMFEMTKLISDQLS